MLSLPPLSLYIHLPWCVAKCPYCDFNSHALDGELPEDRYIDALLADLEVDLPRVWGRPVVSVFLGGGTPSLFSAAAIDRLLSGVRARLQLAPGAEITMEANPGTVEHDRFEAYRAAGINRISLGIQSFDDAQLKTLGRIHSSAEAEHAIEAVKSAGFDRFNLDLMWALPGQSVEEAVNDVERALAFGPRHLSHYQLTLEPNTVFAKHPPALPDEDSVIAIQEACGERLHNAGLHAYEISAWAEPGQESSHNLNYWRFGDYLGIGAGAHGKISLPGEDRILRTRRKSHPRPYLKALDDGSFVAEEKAIPDCELAFEYFLNRFRLDEAIPMAEFEERTGLQADAAADGMKRAVELGLVEIASTGRRGCDPDLRFERSTIIRRTDRGHRFLNDLQACFL
ncbi:MULTISPECIES: radical SAM family heme chaperone HemW [unclassified Wenzhouxiangella]|uniref:radical SAM family heme chaperone HemW n=1 Tax=unclassified Wenzhouxiangella TaxID=2613841 RepID=UPI000E32A4D4|nr:MULTISPECIES: radical SAM family heme chaperone HemW [unclassified Wenzhouxiangella]RFF27314.1 oxygen-independent coproporphyrinogen III oxidase-like protein [Wenzhouxiangella sp. 15181]RFP68747.1 oxygen-independent coproporphyrinogen III oxidase-like protein [Wenzhouxiangella sp. 15190]